MSIKHRYDIVLLFSYYNCSFILPFTFIRPFKSVVAYISLHYCICKYIISIITATIIARESRLCLCNRHTCCNIILFTLVLHSDRFTGFEQMKLRWTESPPVVQWQTCCSTDIFYSLVVGILFLGKERQSGTNNLVAYQVEGSRTHYLRCGNLWRNIGDNIKDGIWHL